MISYINNTENHNKPIRPLIRNANEFVHGINYTDRLPDRAFIQTILKINRQH